MMLDADGNEVQGPGEGILAMKGAWPAMARTLHGDHERFEATYFSPFRVSPPTRLPARERAQF